MSGTSGSQQNDPLALGPFLFDTFEVPHTINWGGAQRLAVHKLPGGERVIDAMGRDDDVISWSGTFLGPNSMERARVVDGLRIAGDALPLTWGGQSYLVFISEFKVEYQHFACLPYRISCTVLVDQSNGYIDTSYDSPQTVEDDTNAAQNEVPQDAPQNLTTTVTTEKPAVSDYSKEIDSIAPPPQPNLPPSSIFATPAQPGSNLPPSSIFADNTPAPFTVDLGPSAAPSAVGPLQSTSDAASAATNEATFSDAFGAGNL
jgi:hypothetical protein